jgi:hypothetical protein
VCCFGSPAEGAQLEAFLSSPGDQEARKRIEVTKKIPLMVADSDGANLKGSQRLFLRQLIQTA